MSLPLVASSAQLLDGQHRLAGIEAAMKIDSAVGERDLLVSMAIGLSTPEAAAIFLNINSEQKPAPRSLIYDLFGEVDSDPDHLINRASDIADELNQNQDSAYLQQIKYPGTARGMGSIDLSTVVTTFKPLLGPTGSFAKIKVKSLTLQKQIVLNYFAAIKQFYDVDGIWENRAKNPFLKASGFAGAIDFLAGSLLVKCSEKKSFKTETFADFLSLDPTQLLLLGDIKNLDGKSARRSVRDYLESNLNGVIPDQDEYEI
jgi:DGQHR domain-containing protein